LGGCISDPEMTVSGKTTVQVGTNAR
jgi:hypothetical protein